MRSRQRAVSFAALFGLRFTPALFNAICAQSQKGGTPSQALGRDESSQPFCDPIGATLTLRQSHCAQELRLQRQRAVLATSPSRKREPVEESAKVWLHRGAGEPLPRRSAAFVSSPTLSREQRLAEYTSVRVRRLAPPTLRLWHRPLGRTARPAHGLRAMPLNRSRVALTRPIGT
jgi:hypothetical protein